AVPAGRPRRGQATERGCPDREAPCGRTVVDTTRRGHRSTGYDIDDNAPSGRGRHDVMLQPQADTATGTARRPPGRAPDPLRRGERAPAPRTLVDILDATVAAHPDAPAIDDGERVLSYAELR